MINIAICDNEPNYLENISKTIKKVVDSGRFESVDFNVFEYHNSIQFLEAVKAYTYDIIFLDIFMPNVDGIEIANEIKEQRNDTLLIFVSNYDSLVFKTLKFQPFRFVRKSKISLELEEAITDAIKHIISFSVTYTVKSHNGFDVIFLSKISHITTDKNYIEFHVNDQKYRERKKLSDVLLSNDFDCFVKINSGTAVNLNYICKIEKDMVGLTSREMLFLSKKYKKDLIQKFLKYTKE